MGRLEGKTAIITGGESGIGRAIAAEFVANGANVIITYLHDANAAAETLAETDQSGKKGMAVQCDVTDPEAVKNLFDKAKRHFNSIDILVNSAGVRGVDKYIHELSFNEFEHVVKTNLFSVFLCCREFVQRRVPGTGDGRIINITSIHEQVVSPGKTDYCSSKAALGGFSKALAMELAEQHITVNNIAPGMILTQMNQRAVDDLDYRRELEQRIPAKISGMPADVAKAALFFASADSAYITGTTQIVDGGLSLARAKGAK